MLKKAAYLLFLLTITFVTHAQVYEPAYIVNVFGDTIRCQLKHIRFISNKKEFRYKKSLDDKKDLYINAKDVLWIVTPKDTFECLAIDKGLYKGEIYAYKLLANGYLRLYEQDHFTKMGGEASASFFIKKKGMLLQEITALDYKKYLSIYVSDWPDHKDKIGHIRYKEEDLKLFVKEYNAWSVTQKKE